MPSKKCEAEGCSKWASFNHPGLKRPQYCRPHSVPGMVNVVSRQRCTYAGCPKQANFNHPGESRGLFCKAHIEEGMVDVRHKHCSHPGCGKQATCNHPNQPTGQYCGQHKLEGMVNVVLKRCQQEGCETFPSFGLPGQPGVQFCRQHKLPGMVRRTAGSMVALPDEIQMDPGRCAHPGCGDCRPIYCYNHFQEHQHDPMNHQIEEAQLHANAHMQGYADLHHLQMQSQQEVHTGDHIQAEGTPVHAIGHSLPVHTEHHMQVGIPEGAYDYTAWHAQQQALAQAAAAHAAQQGIPHNHEMSPSEHHSYEHGTPIHRTPASEAGHYAEEDEIEQSEDAQAHAAYHVAGQTENITHPESLAPHPQA